MSVSHRPGERCEKSEDNYMLLDAQIKKNAKRLEKEARKIEIETEKVRRLQEKLAKRAKPLSALPTAMSNLPVVVAVPIGSPCPMPPMPAVPAQPPPIAVTLSTEQ